MLQLAIKGMEYYDSVTETFTTVPDCTLQLEHSLVSLSKWESRWKKPFLTDGEKTKEETVDYVRCMTINSVRPEVYSCLTNDDLNMISEYIKDPYSATTFHSVENAPKPKGKKETMTAELIYYYMIAANVPFECQKWHLNRLFALLRICGIKQSPPKKMPRKDLYKRNSSLNAARRRATNTSG